MRIAIDFTAFIPQITGVDTYLKQLVLHLAQVDQHNQYRIYHNYEDRGFFHDNFPRNFSYRSIGARPRPVRLISQQFLLPAAIFHWKADVVHSPSFIMPFIRGAARHVLTVHDMTSFSHPHCHIALRRSLFYRQMVLASLRRTDIVIVPSRATRGAILQFLPEFQAERIQVTVPGIGEEFRPSGPVAVQEVLARLMLPQPYILYVGTLEPRKNLPVLLDSYRRLLEAGAIKEHLVLVGKLGWGCEALLQQLQRPVFHGKVHLAGYVDQQDLPAVYTGARLFVYPSLHEGFGFPPLEAMACGVPVVSTLSSSLMENLEGAAELVSPDDGVGLTDAMRRLLTNDTLWAQRRAQGLEQVSRYRWDQTARDTLNSYQMAMAIDRRRGNG